MDGSVRGAMTLRREESKKGAAEGGMSGNAYWGTLIRGLTTDWMQEKDEIVIPESSGR